MAIGLLTGEAAEPYTVIGLSPGIIAVGIAYVLGMRLVYLDQRIAVRTAREQGQEETPAPKGVGLGKAVLGFAVCSGVIFVAGPRLAAAAAELAERSGLGDTLVAQRWSLFRHHCRNLLAALRIGAVDLAIGNVFGSNAFNMVLLVPLDIVQPGSLLAVVSAKHAITCIAAVLATQIAVMGQLYQVEPRTHVIEPDAWLVILVVAGALGLIYYLP